MTNPSAIEGLLESIDLIQKHLSYRSMGLGYGITNPFMELGLSVHYNLKFSIDNQPYVNIYRIEINYEYFGLNNPLTIRENKQYNTMKNTRNRVRLTESQLHNVIKESVKRVLRESGNKWYNDPDMSHLIDPNSLPYNDSPKPKKQEIGDGSFPNPKAMVNVSHKRVEQALINAGYEVEEYGDDEYGNGVEYFVNPSTGEQVEITYKWKPNGKNGFKSGNVTKAYTY